MNENEKYSDFQIAKILEQNNAVINSLASQLEIQKKTIAEKNIQLETWDRISNTDGWTEMAAVAKEVNFKNFGRNKIFEFLRDSNILRYNNEPYQTYVDRGYFKLIEQEVTLPYGEIMINKKPVVSQKGIDFILKLLNKKDMENDSNTEK